MLRLIGGLAIGGIPVGDRRFVIPGSFITNWNGLSVRREGAGEGIFGDHAYRSLTGSW